MYLSILIPALVAFITTYLATPYLIRMLKLEGIVGRDLMKKNKPEVPEMGAPSVLAGFIIGIFLYIGAQTFFIKSLNPVQLSQLLAAISTIMIITFIGTIDVLTHLMDEKEGSKGIEKHKKKGIGRLTHFVLPLPAAVPMMAISVGITTMALPFLGTIDLGLIYPLVLVPLAILGASNATNMLAGFNGMQAGIGIVMSLFLGVFAYINGSVVAALIAFIFAASLLAFLIYNWYPAKIFPGGLDYLVGTVIAIIAIVGNIEKFALFCFVPWFVELVLKLRSRFDAENFGILQKDGTLKAPYKKSYSLTHIVMKLGRFKEWQVSLIIIASIALWCLIGWVIF